MAVQDDLKSFIERIERLTEEKKAVAVDIKEVYASAKSAGFDPKVLRQIVRLRAIPIGERQEQEQLLETYINNLGGL